jgi:hypothetical protein
MSEAAQRADVGWWVEVAGDPDIHDGRYLVVAVYENGPPCRLAVRRGDGEGSCYSATATRTLADGRSLDAEWVYDSCVTVAHPPEPVEVATPSPLAHLRLTDAEHAAVEAAVAPLVEAGWRAYSITASEVDVLVSGGIAGRWLTVALARPSGAVARVSILEGGSHLTVAEALAALRGDA